MIELVIAAIIQLGTLTTDPATTASAAPAQTTATPPPAGGGTGSWDDSN